MAKINETGRWNLHNGATIIFGDEEIVYEPVDCTLLEGVKEFVPVAYKANLTATVTRMIDSNSVVHFPCGQCSALIALIALPGVSELQLGCRYTVFCEVCQVTSEHHWPHPDPEMTKLTRKLLDQTRLLGFEPYWDPEVVPIMGDAEGLWRLRGLKRSHVALEELGWREDHTSGRQELSLYGDRELLLRKDAGAMLLYDIWELGKQGKEIVFASYGEYWGELIGD